MSSANSIILITGVMASGKSTVAQLLSEKMEKSVHLRGDVFRRMIVKGREEMLPEPSQEALRQLHLRYRIAAMAADQYYESGFNVVMQDVILGEALSAVTGYIRSRPLYVVVLCPDKEAVAGREERRSKKGYGAWQISGLDHSLRHETPQIGLWLDTSNLTAEETVEEILRRLEEEAEVG